LAISRSEQLKELLPGLNELFGNKMTGVPYSILPYSKRGYFHKKSRIMPLEYYILDENKELIPATSSEWAVWFEDFDNRRVNETFFEEKEIRVSTVCLGMDHSWGHGGPTFFETMIFGDGFEGDNEYQTRCGTWEEAEVMHKAACEVVSFKLYGHKHEG